MLGEDGLHAPSPGCKNVVDAVPLKLKAVPLATLVMREVVLAISTELPATLMKLSVAFVRPALSTSLPVACFVPT